MMMLIVVCLSILENLLILIDINRNSITIPNHGFRNGEKVILTHLPFQ